MSSQFLYSNIYLYCMRYVNDNLSCKIMAVGICNSRIAKKLWLLEEVNDDDFVLLHLLNSFERRNFRWMHRRIDWEYHVRKKMHESMFEKAYRASYRAFQKLLFVLTPHIRRSAVKSRSMMPIPLHFMVAIGIRNRC